MPVLPQYESHAADQGLTPNNIGMEARAQEGRRVGAFGQQEKEDINQIGRDAATVANTWEEHQTFQQMSAGMAAAATNYNASLQSLGQTLKDPSVDKGDPTIAKSAVDGFKASLDQQGKSFTTIKGQQWWQVHAAEQVDRFQTTAIGLVSQASGVQAVNNLHQTSEAHAATAAADPTQVPGLLDDTAHGYTGMAATATITAETGAKIPEIQTADQAKIADAGAQGAIRGAAAKAAQAGQTDPDAIRTTIQSALDQYMGSDKRIVGLIGEKADEYDTQVERATSRVVTMVKAQAQAGRQQLEDAGHQEFSEIMKESHEYIRSGQAVPPALIARGNAFTDRYGSVLPGETETLNNAFDHSVEDKNSLKFQTSDPRTSAAMSKGILIPEGQPGHIGDADIYKAVHITHTLSVEEGAQLSTAAKQISDNPEVATGRKSLDEWLDTNVRPRMTKSATAASQLNPDGSINFAALGAKPVDLKGDQAYAEARREAELSYMQDVGKGTPPGQASDKLTNPSSAGYIGNRIQALISAKNAPDFDAYVRANPYPAVPAAKGESPAAYLKRVRGHP